MLIYHSLVLIIGIGMHHVSSLRDGHGRWSPCILDQCLDDVCTQEPTKLHGEGTVKPSSPFYPEKDAEKLKKAISTLGECRMVVVAAGFRLERPCLS